MSIFEQLVENCILEGYENLRLDRNGTYWEVDNPFNVYVQVGSKPSNAYYGNSQIYEPVYEKIRLNPGDQIHALAIGDYVIKNGREVYRRPSIKEPKFKPFQKSITGDRINETRDFNHRKFAAGGMSSVFRVCGRSLNGYA